MTPLSNSLFYVLIMALIIFSTRAFPFVLFSKKKPPKSLRFVEEFIPSMVMGVLVIYCLKDIEWISFRSGLKEIASLIIVAMLHIWKKNAMLSIFGGTAFFMVLKYLYI